MGRVDGKVAVVTGGASGIGRASCLLFGREGAAVVVADLDENGAEVVAKQITADGGRAVAQRVDIGDEASIQAMVERAVSEFGALHILFNNAADTSLNAMIQDTPVTEMTVDWWDHAMRIDLRGAMLGCKHAIPHMIAAGGGAIVNTSSNQGIVGDLTQTAYAAAKAGIIQLTQSVATQYGRRGIRCNAVSPGAIRTPALERACPPEIIENIAKHSLVPRIGEPEDLANTVLFLASDESAYITGHVIKVDGGQLAHLPHYAYSIDTGTTTTYTEDSGS
ncbi:MAG TPA: SDR family NAD(P)-dependent oxidoreductase [Acidimicrobiia bacterium]|nr:SDR family NAD(P)-dependent oxidoreductase [Acidimicrobiia bacterium]